MLLCLMGFTVLRMAEMQQVQFGKQGMMWMLLMADCVTLLQMADVRQLLFGKQGMSSQLPWPFWKQGFFFSDRPGLSFGLLQRQGGPCGLLAAVQVALVCCLQPFYWTLDLACLG